MSLLCSDSKPVVTCSFVTEFEDHITVAMDAEAFLFLHDLVMNYVKEKDRGKHFVIFIIPSCAVDCSASFNQY